MSASDPTRTSASFGQLSQKACLAPFQIPIASRYDAVPEWWQNHFDLGFNMAAWIARLMIATTLIFTSGVIILSFLLGSLAMFFTLGLVKTSAHRRSLADQ